MMLNVLFAVVVVAAGVPGPSGQDTPRKEKPIVMTIVYDNYPFDKRLKTDWGFACVVAGTPETILFDTGARGDVLLANMRTLGIEPDAIDVVALSHTHGDHTGGLATFLRANPKVKVFMPKVFPGRLKAIVRKAGATLVETTGPAKVCEGVWTTGVVDGPIPEQGIVVEHGGRPVVVTGCAHPGIVKLAAAAGAHLKKPVFAVLGGFHMGGASQQQIQTVIEGLKALGVRRAAPSHCSGDDTRRRMEEAFGEGYVPSGLGARLTFED